MSPLPSSPEPASPLPACPHPTVPQPQELSIKQLRSHPDVKTWSQRLRCLAPQTCHQPSLVSSWRPGQHLFLVPSGPTSSSYGSTISYPIYGLQLCIPVALQPANSAPSSLLLSWAVLSSLPTTSHISRGLPPSLPASCTAEFSFRCRPVRPSQRSRFHHWSHLSVWLPGRPEPAYRAAPFCPASW